MADDPLALLSQDWPYAGNPGSPVSAAAIRAAAVDDQTYARALVARLASLTTAHSFQLGQLVRWKRGLRHMSNPASGRPAIVAEVLSEPLVNTFVTPDSPYFGEILDLRVGIINDEGVFYLYLVPSSRFEPYTV